MKKMTIDEIIAHAIAEDIPNGDLTTDLIGEFKKTQKAQLVAKEDIVLSGTEAFEKTFLKINPDIKIKWFFKDGELVVNKQTIAVISGESASLLKAERTALNFLGRLSGIASLTKCFVEETRSTKCKILDTRKTTPLLRELEKKAVKDGGGENHRMNLSDAILIKENHIAAAGGIAAAIDKIRNKSQLPIEIEVRNFDEAQAAAEKSAERLLLDNMSNDEMKRIIENLPGFIQTEASGNMSLERIAGVAKLGVHFISVGALTHSAPCADISLIFVD